MNQKLLIILLVAIVVIFLITLGISGCHGSGKPDADNPGAVGALKGLQGKHFLKLGDKATVTPNTCAQGPTTLRVNGVNGVCIVSVEKRAFFRKSTRVALVANAPMSVFVNPKNGPQVNKAVNAGRCFGSAVDHAGGTIQISGTNATVTVLQHGCPKEKE